MIVIDGRLTPADRAVSPYRLVPFVLDEVPVALRIRLALDPPQGNACSVDLGLFGPGSTEFGSDAFRGWSGSERSEVWLGDGRATPGYRPGPLPAGTWRVLLGLDRIPASGCTFRLTVESLERSPHAWPPDAPPLPSPTSTANDGPVDSAFPSATGRGPDPGGTDGPGWYRGDLHCHTVHSDGAETPETVVAAARKVGLDFLAVTDHNTDSHLPWLRALAGRELLLIAGEEITTYAGHANAWGIERWIDFRPDVGPGVAGSIAAAHAQGALVSINHPKPDDPWLHDPDLPVDAVEVWNGPWSGSDPAHANDISLAWWADRLARGLRATAVGGSDMHGFRADQQPIGTPVTWVRADSLSGASILAGIRAGRVVITRDPIGPRPDLHARTELGRRASIGDALAVGPGEPVEVDWRVVGGRGTTVRLVSARGLESTAAVESGDARGTFRLEPPTSGTPGGAAGHVRLEVVDRIGGVVGLTNPVHLVPALR